MLRQYEARTRLLEAELARRDAEIQTLRRQLEGREVCAESAPVEGANEPEGSTQGRLNLIAPSR